jgi:hypothetical protein
MRAHDGEYGGAEFLFIHGAYAPVQTLLGDRPRGTTSAILSRAHRMSRAGKMQFRYRCPSQRSSKMALAVFLALLVIVTADSPSSPGRTAPSLASSSHTTQAFPLRKQSRV